MNRIGYCAGTGAFRDTIIGLAAVRVAVFGEHGWFDKRWMYEESPHTPLIVRWPGVMRPGIMVCHSTTE